MLNLYQHPDIYPYVLPLVLSQKIIDKNVKKTLINLDQFISDEFFKLTTVFKEYTILPKELWAGVARYLKLKDVNLERPGWHYEEIMYMPSEFSQWNYEMTGVVFDDEQDIYYSDST